MEENQYLDLIKTVINVGNTRSDRTNIGTLSIFGGQHRWSLINHTLPLLTTKRVFWRGVVEELLWFISGNTNNNKLVQRGVHIWDGNSTRDFLDSRGIDREEGDLGPIYSHQWRHYGAPYVNCHTNYNGQGIDQLAECIRLIKEDPFSRRIILNSWNPAQLGEMSLPPCHVMCQFYVTAASDPLTKSTLSCLMYQRSCDIGLGMPFNIASYSLLTHMIAHVCGLLPGEFIHTFGDAHIYSTHVTALQEQITRQPRAFPTLRIVREVTNINDFVFDDFELVGYNPHKSIKMEMCV